jgi:ubiquinone/menaquinone biosynthesis C-methylase UbiE
MALNIFRGDMRRLPFPDESFSFVYSYNAIDFMIKPDIARAMGEITRVLRPEGLCYVDFLSVDDTDSWEPFCETAPNRDLLRSERFAHHEDDEAEAYLAGFVIVRKEKRRVEWLEYGRRWKKIMLEYIAQKMPRP